MSQAIPTRLILAVLFALFSAHAVAQVKPRSAPTSFGDYFDRLWPDAQARGIKRATFDAAFKGLTPDARVVAATLRQPEFGRPAGSYVNGIASKARIENAVRMAAQWSGTLDALEKQSGVSRWVILGLWGIESSFGADSGDFDVIRSLSTLALIGYREAFFRDELLAALSILQSGDIPREKMLGSWAGAMGQPQFMPSSFIRYGVDFNRDGRRDIWATVPDVLASIANYLGKWGWKSELGWGYEVDIPKKFDYLRSHATFSEWVELGIRRADGRPLPANGDAILFFPSGASGPAFLVTDNFTVLKRYNNSDLFALSVSHLGDRARGGEPFRAPWPADDRQLSRGERIALQEKLSDMGYTVFDFDGRIDFHLRDSIRDVQSKNGMLPDGHPTAALLARIGAAPP
jgi:lytic murein transglycosylase